MRDAHRPEVSHVEGKKEIEGHRVSGILEAQRYREQLAEDLEYVKDIIRDNRTESSVYFKTKLLQEVFYTGVAYGARNEVFGLTDSTSIESVFNTLDEIISGNMDEDDIIDAVTNIRNDLQEIKEYIDA